MQFSMDIPSNKKTMFNSKNSNQRAIAILAKKISILEHCQKSLENPNGEAALIAETVLQQLKDAYNLLVRQNLEKAWNKSQMNLLQKTVCSLTLILTSFYLPSVVKAPNYCEVVKDYTTDRDGELMDVTLCNNDLFSARKQQSK